MRLLEKGPSLASPLDAGERGCKKRLSSGASTTARPAAFSMMFPEKISVTRGNPVSAPTVLRHHSGFFIFQFPYIKYVPGGEPIYPAKKTKFQGKGRN